MLLIDPDPSWLADVLSRAKSPLAILGFSGQAVFFMRFLVQWIASEKRGQSVIPLSFWYISIAGSFMLLAYGVLDRDPVIIVGQCTGTMIYLRNLHLIKRSGKETEQTR
ncbi:MAG: lipid-A-disaccharide synthase N-terminal domain-containing protein [Planctomycetes bacterium]|nr:lipid-A-disaccharide synthase N-terminal domain-containing protein [Planctomycetota bacterium]